MDLGQIANALESQFPDAGPLRPCRLLGTGFNSVAVETNNDLVFRIGRTSLAGYAKEARLLPALAARVPTPIPNPRWFVESSEAFPYGAIGYEKIAGSPLNALPENCDVLAADVARFLHALHGFPADEAAALGVPLAGPAARWLGPLRDEAMASLRELMTATEIARLDSWWDDVLADSELEQYVPALCHYDFWMENLLVDLEGGRLAGVLDFERALVGDRAQDFATLLDLGEPFVEAVEQVYSSFGGTLDPGHAHRRKRHWELRPLGGLSYGIRHDNPHEIASAIAKLRRGPVLHGAF